MIGQVISHYEILMKLGEGGMGVVYKAKDRKLGRFVALKFLPHYLRDDAIQKQRFMQEAQAASALDHENIGTIHEINESPDGQVFIAMACYEGENLVQKVRRAPLPLDEAMAIASQMASGLSFAHGAGVVHRDIKPANILSNERGQIKIVDFGLAKFLGRTQLTKTGGTVGTPSYMSPEQTHKET